MGNNQVVEDLARSFPPNRNKCGCAELNAISNAMNKGMDLRGAVIVTIEVRGPESPTGKHGQTKPACSVCAAVIEELEMIEC
jgi:Cytidine and deoxycytidylate deaminase zinc-binding region